MDDGQRLQRMLDAFVGAERAVIMTHDNPDPDSLASAMTLQVILREKLGLPSLIVYGGILGRAENRQMVSALGIPAVALETTRLRPQDRIALVDTQPLTGNNSLPEGIIPAMVLDHHPLRLETVAATHYDVREGFGATATLAYRYLKAARIRPSRALATALFVAIKVETRDLTREVSPADTEAYQALLPLVDRRAIAEIDHAPVSRQYFRTLGQAIEGTSLYGPVAVAGLGNIEAPEIVAEYADMLGRLEGIRWVLSAGVYEDDLYLSIRTNQEEAHAGSLIQALVRGLGKAGGHGSMAGGRIPLTRSYQETLEEVRERFLNLMGADHMQGEPL